MDTNKHELLFGEEVCQVVGCAMEVLNTLGHGLLEKPYPELQTRQTRMGANCLTNNISVHSCALVVLP